MKLSVVDQGTIVDETSSVVAECLGYSREAGPTYLKGRLGREDMAVLFASAPDLLEALEAIIDYAESDIADRRRLIDSDEAAAEVEAAEWNMARARAAIRKATATT